MARFLAIHLLLLTKEIGIIIIKPQGSTDLTPIQNGSSGVKITPSGGKTNGSDGNNSNNNSGGSVKIKPVGNKKG